MNLQATDAVGGIVLCGGRSSRMGRPKAWLQFGEETALERVVRILSEVVTPIVVVAGRQQQLPPLPESVGIVRDDHDYLGPLAGIAQGLTALRPRVAAAYVSGCDVPLLQPEFVRAVIAELGEADAAVPFESDYYHPLAGVYRTVLAEKAQMLVESGRLRPLHLIEQCHCVAIPVDQLRGADPELGSLKNMNRPEDYERLRGDVE